MQPIQPTTPWLGQSTVLPTSDFSQLLALPPKFHIPLLPTLHQLLMTPPFTAVAAVRTPVLVDVVQITPVSYKSYADSHDSYAIHTLFMRHTILRYQIPHLLVLGGPSRFDMQTPTDVCKWL